MRYFKDNIDAILIILIFSLNILRYLFNFYGTNSFIYSIYILCIYFLFRRYSKNVFSIINKQVGIRNIFILSILIISYAILSISWNTSFEAVQYILKYLITTIIACLCLAMPINKINIILNGIIFLNILYGILLITNPFKVNSYISGDTNYLNMTISLGLSLSITLVRCLQSLFIFNGKKVLIYGLLSIFSFLVLIMFAARGVLLFPFIISVILIPFFDNKKLFKSVLIISVLCAIAVFALSFYLSHANEYIANRFLSLFSNTSEESRVSIWIRSIDMIQEESMYIFGGGVGSMVYPHNMFIQYIGEYGFIGLVYLLVSAQYILKLFFKSLKVVSDDLKPVLFGILAGLLYYFMTFNKSFTIYDIGSLQIMYTLSVALLLQLIPLFKSDKLFNNYTSSKHS
ncbi:MAG: O-antigen ligase family protein [Bacteroidales bacterium]|nr:O-antigen ligase family protein [Bacteroidales bacterium]